MIEQSQESANFARNALYEKLSSDLRQRDSVSIELDCYSKLAVALPVNFSEFEIPRRFAIKSDRIFELVDSSRAAAVAKYLRAGDFEFLAYYTCRVTDRLSDSVKRMDWFFFLDEHLDVVLTGKKERQSCIVQLMESLPALNSPSASTHVVARHTNGNWIAIANTLLSELIAPVSSFSADGVSLSPRQRILLSVKDYYQGLLDEEDLGDLSWYIETRIRSIGVIPEIEFCFAYSSLTLDYADSLEAQVMARAAAIMILVQNDLISAKKEKVELGLGIPVVRTQASLSKAGNAAPSIKLSLPSFAKNPNDLGDIALRLYSSQFNLFHRLRPTNQETPLYSYWQCCNDWVCGSLIWHLLSPRYHGAVSQPA